MIKNRIISNELMVAFIKYHLGNVHDNEELNQFIKDELTRKLKQMCKHDVYTTSKTAPTEEEREEARQNYLDDVGMHPDFRW